jgi:hypothetical protein
MVKIAFWDNGLGERGTTVALYDYAYYNKHYLNNESIILYNVSNPVNVYKVVKKFEDDFKVFPVGSFDEVDNILVNTGCNILYIIKSGELDNNISKVIKTVVHCVFKAHQPHGDIYATISPWVDGNDEKFPVVPHMINLPNHTRNMRAALGIPEDAIVFGRIGGYDQFDLSYVHEVVKKVIKTTSNIYFVMVNTRDFCPNHPRVIHLNKIIDLDKKVEFINTCDAMIWGRSDGETFGLSIAEFSIKNKPVFTTIYNDTGTVLDKCHENLLNDKAIWYDRTNLESLILSFNKTSAAEKDWNAYNDYTPEKVMDIFKKVFID